MKRTSLEIPRWVQEKIPTSPAKEGFMGAVKFFNNLTLYGSGADEFPEYPYMSVKGAFLASHSKGAFRNLLLLIKSATRMTGFLKENYMERPAIEVTVYHEKVVVAKFLAVFWHDGKIAGIDPLKEWDMHTGVQTLRYLGGSRFVLVD